MSTKFYDKPDNQIPDFSDNSKLTAKEYLASQKKFHKNGKPRLHPESDLQASAVIWFKYNFPQLHPLLFSVPNGSKRTKAQSAILIKEGAVSGVSDLIMLIPNKHYNALCLETKTTKGSQSDTQKVFQQAVESQGYCYKIYRSLDEFRDIIHKYLNHFEL